MASGLTRQLFTLLIDTADCFKSPKDKSNDFVSFISIPGFPAYTLNFLDVELNPLQKKQLNALGRFWNKTRDDLGIDEVYVPKFRDDFTVHKSEYDPSLFKYNQPMVYENPEYFYYRKTELDSFAKYLFASDGEVMKVLSTHTPETAEEIALTKGQFVRLLKQAEDWCKIRTQADEEGYCPANMLIKVKLI